MKKFPKISIVTPSFNQGRFLEQTIVSVLDQNYPELEYFIFDGGSTDNSVEIIKKYSSKLTYWISEKDNGQADAIYRGFEMATGDILAWINSDDYYLPGAFAAVAAVIRKHPEAELIVGAHRTVDEINKIVYNYPAFAQRFDSLLVWGQHIPQMGSFWTRKAFFDTGGFDRSLRFAFDYDLLLRLTKRAPPARCSKYLAVQRAHRHTKTNTLWESVGIQEAEQLQTQHALKMYGRRDRSIIIARSEMAFAALALLACKNLLHRPINYMANIAKLLHRIIRYLRALVS